MLESEAKEADVQRLNGAYIYVISAAFGPLKSLSSTTTKENGWSAILTALVHLDSLLNQQKIRLPTTKAPALALKASLQSAQNTLMRGIPGTQGDPKKYWSDPLDFVTANDVRSKAEGFESVLLAELQISDIYVITERGGFDTTILAESGEAIFPDLLGQKVPEAQSDAKAAARCIAFDLPTAAAFHLHRVNELVLRRYYDLVTGGKPHPENRGIGNYIDAMKNHHVGDKIVFGALATLKNLHRNPVIHPDQQLESIEEAIGLHGSVRAVIGYMLKALPPEELKLLPPPSEESEKK